MSRAPSENAVAARDTFADAGLLRLVSPVARPPAGFRIDAWLIAGSEYVASFATLT